MMNQSEQERLISLMVQNKTLMKENEELKHRLAVPVRGKEETVTRKCIWIIFFELYTDWVAANSLEEALSYFHKEAQSKILKAERSNSEITYKY